MSRWEPGQLLNKKHRPKPENDQEMIQFPDHKSIHTYTHLLRSRYGETDQMGYVYYGRYLEYFEVARTEMIRKLGLPYSKMEEEGVMLPVVNASVVYKSPVYYDEKMQIRVLVYDMPLVRLETYYEVFTDRQKQPHVLGKVTLAFTDKNNRKPCRAPGSFLEKLEGTSG